jgi:membrane-bound metal-dependent hydrolase YbcI (DUF457 family)
MKMHAKTRFLFLFTLSLLVVIGLTIAATIAVTNENYYGAVLIIIGLILFIALTFSVLSRSYREMKEDIPVQDERSKKIRLFAAGYAYFFSFHLWLVLFIFHKQLQTDDMMMMGLLGMVLAFGTSYMIMRKRKV